MKVKKALNFVFECENKVLLTVFILYAIGFVYGCLSTSVVTSFTNLNYDTLLGDNLFSIFIKDVSFLVVIFLLGYSVIGIPFICCSVVYMGITDSVVYAYFSYLYGIKGSLLASVSFYIYFLLLFVSIACISYSSVRLSLSLLGIFKNNTRYVSPRHYSVPHIIKFLFFIVIVAICSIYYWCLVNNFIFLLL